MKAMSSYEQIPQITAIVGENAVFMWNSVEIGRLSRIDQVFLPSATLPSCVVYPKSEAELVAIQSLTYRNKWRVLICGSASKLSWGNLVSDIDLVISTERMNQVIEHAVGDLTVTVYSGMKFVQLQSMLEKTKQFLALDPNPLSTIGGIIATGDTGSLRQRYGSVRDQLLGITFVLANGQIAKAGGRVVKNVAGYDLMKLFTGSYGSLGIITQATFRLYPMQSASSTVILTGSSDVVQQAADILRGSALTPTQADLLSSQMVSNLDLGKGLGLIARFQSIAESVKEQASRLLDVGKNLGLQSAVYDLEDEKTLWQKLQQQIYSDGNMLLIKSKIGILPTAAVEVFNLGEGIVHISSGLGILQFESIDKALEARTLCQKHGGYLTILEAPASVKQKVDVWGYTGNALSLMQRIKQQFDPENILNPGRFIA
ncbi:MAG: FAD-binding oxidoreductase [Calothrix sp. C42_A2020_038]|nr:FAD-binding oxidoreductase [Calothrix sp. C42_A2020_038]